MSVPPSRCDCPQSVAEPCSPNDHARDSKGRQLCCPYDERAMAAFYGIAFSAGWQASPGRRAAMRKRRAGTLEEIAQRAAATRRGE